MNKEMTKERCKELYFKNHVASIKFCDNIVIIDYKDPSTTEGRIRFMFEEDYFRLHISGDYGELIACNCCNMTFEKFDDFLKNHEYFVQKIMCMSRPLYVYDEELARNTLESMIKDFDIEDNIRNEYIETDLDPKEAFIQRMLDHLDITVGSDNEEAYELLGEVGVSRDECYEYGYGLDSIGRKTSDIIDLYLYAYELAMEQIVNELS